MFKIKNEKLYYFYYILFSVLYLWIFSGPYFNFLEETSTYGDQKIYHLFYERVKGLGYLESFEVYKTLFASEEIFYNLFVYISSYLGLSKASAMTLANIVMFCLLIKITANYIKPSFIIFFFYLTNEYFNNLFFELERLKFAFIFFLILVNFYHIKSIRILSIILSILSHFSFIFLYAVIFILYFRQIKIFHIKYNKVNLDYLFLIIFLIIFILYFEGHIITKLQQFNFVLEILNYKNFFKPLIFLLLISYVYNFKVNIKVILFFIIFAILSLLHEHSRFVFFAFIFFYYQLLTSSNNKKKKLILYLFLTYSSTQFFYKLIYIYDYF